MPPSSRFTAMDRAQNRDFGPGSMQVERRADDQDPSLTDALGNLVRFVSIPRERFDAIGVEPLIDGGEFGGLIADKAFDASWIVVEPRRPRGGGRDLAALTTKPTGRHRPGDL